MALIAYWIADQLDVWGSDPTGAQIAAGLLSDNTPAGFAGSEPVSGTPTNVDEATAITGLDPGTIFRTAWVLYDDVALAYSSVAVGDITTHASIVQTTGAALSGTLSTTGNVAFTLPTLNVSASTVAVTGTLTSAGDIGFKFNVTSSGAIKAAGTVAVSGDIQIGLPQVNLVASTVALSAAASAAGNIDPLDAPFDLGGGAVALTGSADVAGNLGLTINLSAQPISVAGTLAAAGDFLAAEVDPNAAKVWAHILPNGKTAAATLVEVHSWLNELHLIHGLRAGAPLNVTQVARTAGAVSQSVAESGGGVTVERL